MADTKMPAEQWVSKGLVVRRRCAGWAAVQSTAAGAGARCSLTDTTFADSTEPFGGQVR